MKDSGVDLDPRNSRQVDRRPGAVIPGNGMSPPYSGITDAAIRQRIIAFLKTLGP